MTPHHPQPTDSPVAVVGAGAVGSYFGALLARAGQPVTLIGRAPHVQAIRRQGLQLQTAGGAQTLALAAETEIAAVRGAKLVLVCVKAMDTEAVARALAPWLDEDATVLSLQNGVDNAATLARHLRQDLLAGVVYAATALPAPGVVRHLGGGDLVVGVLRSARTDGGAGLLRELVQRFAAAGVAVRISADVKAEAWCKLVVNCAWNAVSALTHANYAQIEAQPDLRRLQRALVCEAVAVARADGVALGLDAALAAVAAVGQRMPLQHSSTAQDLARGRRTEIDHLNGHVVRRGAALGIATPVNQALLALVKGAEATAGAERGPPSAQPGPLGEEH